LGSLFTRPHAPLESQPAPGDRWAPATLVSGFLLVHLVSLIAYRFVPIDTWPHPLWQTLSTGFSTLFMVVGARRSRLEASLGWYLIAAGIFLNAWGVTVDLAMFRFFGVRERPNLADAFWSAQFPLVVLGLVIFARRVTAREDLGEMMRNTVICVPLTFFIGVYAWQLVAWRLYQSASVPLAYKIVVTSYPFGNLMYLVLLLRLALGVGVKNVSMLLMLAWLLLLLPSDLGWPIFLRMRIDPSPTTQYLMEASWMTANALLGAATWHPSAREISRSVDGRVPALGGIGWVCLLACILAAPLVVLLQLVLDRLYSLTSV
jgi:hypothetical protein